MWVMTDSEQMVNLDQVERLAFTIDAQDHHCVTAIYCDEASQVLAQCAAKAEAVAVMQGLAFDLRTGTKCRDLRERKAAIKPPPHEKDDAAAKESAATEAENSWEPCDARR